MRRSGGPLAWPFVGSLIAHVAAATWLAPLADERASGFTPHVFAPITATLVALPQHFALTDSAVDQPPATPVVRPRVGTGSAPSPRPLKPTQRPHPVEGAPEGNVTIAVLDGADTVDFALEALIEQIFPGAIRMVTDFEVPPPGIYPRAALAEKRQLHVTVMAIIHKDGRVELLPGSFEDPLFTPSIKASLASARARPHEVDGRPRIRWTLLSFAFEFVGAP